MLQRWLSQAWIRKNWLLKKKGYWGYDPSGIDLEAWTELEEQLVATIPNYDRVNKWMTFGQDKNWRKSVAKHALEGMNVLEVGCGPAHSQKQSLAWI